VEPDRPAALRGIEALPRRVQVMPADAGRIKAYIEAHA
jgi:threonine synthase